MSYLQELSNEYKFSWISASLTIYYRHTLPQIIREIRERKELLERGSEIFEDQDFPHSVSSDDRVTKRISEEHTSYNLKPSQKFVSDFGPTSKPKRLKSNYERSNSRTFSKVSKSKKIKTYGAKILPAQESTQMKIWVDAVSFNDKAVAALLEKMMSEEPMLQRLNSKYELPGESILLQKSKSNQSSDMQQHFELYDIYTFLNRSLIKALKSDSRKMNPQTIAELIKLDFALITDELSRSTSFFCVWLDLCLEKTIGDFNNTSHSTEAELVLCLENMFNSIKIFSSTISKAFHLILNRPEEEGSLISSPEEKFLIPIFDVIFNKKTFNKESIRRSMVASGIKARKFPLKELYFNALKRDNDALMKKFSVALPAFEPDIHPLLRLDLQSLKLIQEVINGDEEVEFIISARWLDPEQVSIDEGLARINRTPFAEAIKQLETIEKKDSPFEKAVHVLNTVKQVSHEISQFFRDNNIEVKLSLTSEELFPIMAHILKAIAKSSIFIDLVLCYTFLPVDIKSSDAGYYTHILLTAFYFISSEV